MSHLGEAHDIITQHHTTCNQTLAELVTKTKHISHDKIKISSPTGLAVQADTTYTPVADEDERPGWLFKKAVADDAKFNYYFYATGSHPLPLSSLNNVHLTCSIDKWEGISSAPIVVVYTKPTGSGDASWYKSKVAYALTSTNKIVVGELVNMYCLENPQLNNGNRDIQLSNVITDGTAAPEEEIYLISVQSDSASAIDTKILVSHVGYKLNNEISRNIALIS